MCDAPAVKGAIANALVTLDEIAVPGAQPSALGPEALHLTSDALDLLCDLTVDFVEGSVSRVACAPRCQASRALNAAAFKGGPVDARSFKFAVAASRGFPPNEEEASDVEDKPADEEDV